MYVCAEVAGPACAKWILVSDAYGLSTAEGVRVGSMFLGLCIGAWIGRFLLTTVKRI